MNKIFLHRDSMTTIIGVVIPIGGYYETKEHKGIAHFIEHLCFKGTPTRSQREINECVERYGGDINAYTCEENTVYHSKIANQYKDQVLDMLLDITTNPTFPKKEIEKEREVIIQEMKRSQDDVCDELSELYNSVYYPRESGFHLPLIGTENSLYNIDRKAIKNYWQEHYGHKTLVIIGDVEDKVEIEHTNFKKIMEVIPKQPQKEVIKEKTELSQAHIIMSADVKIPEVNITDKTFYLNLLGALYNDMGGRLFQEIREKNNLVYGVRFNGTTYSDGRVSWQVGLGLDKKNIQKARKLVEKELTRPFSKKEIEYAIGKCIGGAMMDMENLDHLLDIVAYGIRKGIDYNEVINNFESNINRIVPTINEFVKEMNFKDNVMVGLVPK